MKKKFVSYGTGGICFQFTKFCYFLLTSCQRVGDRCLGGAVAVEEQEGVDWAGVEE